MMPSGITPTDTTLFVLHLVPAALLCADGKRVADRRFGKTEVDANSEVIGMPAGPPPHLTDAASVP